MSRFHEIFVIARNSTFTYKGRSVDVRLVATELGVRYVLEGSIRKAADRVRVTGQLIDALTGSHIWAERYDRVLKDIFAVQEELTRNIVRAIAPQILDAEAEKIRRRRPEDLNAYEIAVRANAKAWEAWWKSDGKLRDAAIADAAAALAIDPRSTTALGALRSIVRSVSLIARRRSCWPFPAIAITSTRLWPAPG
jgi:adenylate cyclase